MSAYRALTQGPRCWRTKSACASATKWLPGYCGYRFILAQAAKSQRGSEGSGMKKILLQSIKSSRYSPSGQPRSDSVWFSPRSLL